MDDMSFYILALVCLSLSYSNGSTCNDQNNCISCTSRKSWTLLANCRWCPQDSECHTYGSLANKCSITQNIKDSNDCDKIVYAEYDRNLAYKMVYLCSLAYSDNVAKYITKASEVNTFELVKQVTKPCSGDALCSGFVAVSHSEKAIAIAFRGTEHFKQLVNEIRRILTEPKTRFEAGGKVQRYFLDALEVVWNDLRQYVDEKIKNNPSYKVWVTGHSLGGALASLASTLIMYEGKTSRDNLLLYTFGQPRVGNYYYARAHDDLVPLSFRVTHYRDVVVHLPTCHTGIPGSACIALGGGPYHHGNEIYYGDEIMTKNSPYKTCKGLPHNEDLGCSNNPTVWLKCLPAQLPQCIEDHKQYFSVSVGTWWKNLVWEKKSGVQSGVGKFRSMDFVMIVSLAVVVLFE